MYSHLIKETQMKTTYTEAQYSTEDAKQMIREKFLPSAGPDGYTKEDIECAAKYMSKSLRIGGMKSCRALVLNAIAA
jgi:hypothetical protein